MLEHTVTNRAELVAAVRAAAQTTHAEARKNPVHITCGTTAYRFPNGLHTSRAEQIVRNILRTTKKAFEVPEVLL